MIRSHSARALTARNVSPANTSGQSASAFIAAMNASVTSTDRLNMRSRFGSCLASMNASMSGWSQRITPIIAPRREPADMMVRHMASHTSMKLSGPEASAPTPFTAAPFGRSVEKSAPMPPPCCMVSAASFRPSKMPDMESSSVPMTKQLNSVTRRPEPAPARMRPAGRNLRSPINPSKACAQRSRKASGSACATARATRPSECAGLSSPGRRYFIAQMSRAMGSRSGSVSGSGSGTNGTPATALRARSLFVPQTVHTS